MISNVHGRRLPATADAVGALVDSLASDHDRLWPDDRWPPVRFDRPLAVGARGGHGPIRYTVAEYQPGRLVRFRFHAPAGFHGYHEYAVLDDPAGATLRHRLVMTTSGWAKVSWPLVYRPLHDALIEDSLDRATLHVGATLGRRASWSPLVRVLRRLARPRFTRRRPVRKAGSRS